MSWFPRFMFFQQISKNLINFELSRDLPANTNEFEANSFDSRIKSYNEFGQSQKIVVQQSNQIAELEAENLTKPYIQEQENVIDDTSQTKGRVTQPQKALFSLLVAKNYQGFDTRNSLFTAINAELKAMGLIAVDIKPDTFYRLIDDNLPENKAIFPNQ